MGGALILLVLTAVTLIWFETKSKKKINKIKAKANAISSNKQQLLDKLEELPSWVDIIWKLYNTLQIAFNTIF